MMTKMVKPTTNKITVQQTDTEDWETSPTHSRANLPGDIEGHADPRVRRSEDVGKN